MGMNKPDKSKPGPEPERLEIEDEWESAVKKALEKKRPAGGWPSGTGRKGGAEPKA